MGNSIDIINDTTETIQIIVTPNESYSFDDLFNDTPSFSVNKHGDITCLKDLWQTWRLVLYLKEINLYNAVIDDVKNLFDRYGMSVRKGNMCDMNAPEVFNYVDLLTSEGYHFMKNAFQYSVAIFIQEDNGRYKLVQYDSDRGMSWQTHKDYVARHVHGTLWEDGAHLKEFQTITRRK